MPVRGAAAIRVGVFFGLQIAEQDQQDRGQQALAAEHRECPPVGQPNPDVPTREDQGLPQEPLPLSPSQLGR